MDDRHLQPQTQPEAYTVVPWWHIQSLSLGATCGSLPAHYITLTLQDEACQAVSHFEADFSLPGILIHQPEGIGVLSRKRFYEMMSRPFSLELFTKRPLAALWKFLPKTALVLEQNVSVTLAARYALQRDLPDIYEPVVVQRSAQQYSVVDIHTLLLAQSTVNELALAELTASQAALAKEKDLAQITLTAIADGVITTDDQGLISDMNPMAERLTGHGRQSALGKSIVDVFKPFQEVAKKVVANPVIEALEIQETIYSSKNTAVQQGGKWLDIQYSASPIFD